MIGAWVDTDFGFDDLWALLLLQHLNCKVAGVSLVAGNAPLPQVAANAAAAKAAYGFNWPLTLGAARPLKREPETAVRILGPTGMPSRGMRLDIAESKTQQPCALSAMHDWLRTSPDDPHEILALGPLTNIAQLLEKIPDLRKQVSRLVWMGGSAGTGNHTPVAEFNAVADAEALSLVVASGLPLDIVDLTFCRTVTFGPNDLPDADPLTLDLLGGYLDIALERGHSDMAIYDPTAALALARPNSIQFKPCTISVETGANAYYGATKIAPATVSHTRISVRGTENLSQICIGALESEPGHVSRL